MKNIGIAFVIGIFLIIGVAGASGFSNKEERNEVNSNNTEIAIKNEDNSKKEQEQEKEEQDQEECEHDFGDVECTKNRRCKKCHIKMDPIGHKWKDATCEEPKICEVCGETEGKPLGHTVKYGECSRCGKQVDNLTYKDNYAVVTNSDREWMKKQKDFVNICVSGKIIEIQEKNDVIILDAENQKWCVGLGTGCDFSSYNGTNCEVYGSCSGGTSDLHDNLPYINMSHESDHLIFFDGKIIYPKIFSSTQQFPSKPLKTSNPTVWVASGGKKYHSNPNCSHMKNPTSMTRDDALNKGYTACNVCW